jgi:hypothetical protein
MLPANPNEPAASEAPRRRFRKLRIAWSVGCGILCLLLIVLWVRSLRAEDRLSGHFDTSFGFRIYSSRGCIVCYAPNMPFQPSNVPWHLAIGSEYWLGESDPRIASVPKLHYHREEMWATLPHWFLLGTCVTFATVPWLPYRYSLRTLLIATTLVAVLLWLIVWLQ